MNGRKLYQNTISKFEHELQFLNDKSEETPDSTVRACWLKAAGIPKSAEQSLKYTLPILTEVQLNLFDEYINKRLNKIPLAHITGRQSFLGIELVIDQRALIPRKETELLANAALELSYKYSKKNQEVHIMDICCGAGNLGLSLAYHNEYCIVYSTDLSQDAVDLANENIVFLHLKNRVSAVQGNLFSAFQSPKYFNKANFIVCNPPYIPSIKVSELNAETLEHEPEIAFDGGISGLELVGKVIKEAPLYLAENGWLLMEVGVGQGDFVSLLCKRSYSYKNVENIKDKDGNVRVVMAQKNN
jgi:release factor glutamine methyltransferase